MSQSYTHYHDIMLPVILGESGVIYLRSTNQKRLFAKKRAMYLKRAISKYNQIQTILVGNTLIETRKTTSFSMEIEFDHFVLSLRSCVEHLMQLINFVANLHLSPTSYDRVSRVDADNVISRLKNTHNTVLCRLAAYLDKEKGKDWYKTLHKLRIEIYHNKFDKFSAQGQQIKLELPNHIKMDLTTYCNLVSVNVERILTFSSKSLVEFLGL